MLLIPYIFMGIIHVFKLNFNLLYFQQGIGFLMFLFGQIVLLVLSFYISIKIYADSRKNNLQ